MDRDRILKILKTNVKQGDWDLVEAEKGRSKVTYIGTLGNNRVFIKNDIASPALLRLSELGIAPKVIYSSDDADLPILIQEYVEAVHPTKKEINDRYRAYATLFEVFHNDDKLTKIVAKPHYTYNNAVDSVIEWMREWAEEIKDLSESTMKFMSAIERDRPQDVSDSMVPIHADPNNSNFMVTADKIYIVDWDDIRILDPLRDVGQFCYEYVDKENWNEFFTIVGIDLNPERLKRMYWWVAIMKIIIAYWFYLYPKEVEVYDKLIEESRYIYYSKFLSL
jgi:thiamine kinase-like enzyme